MRQGAGCAAILFIWLGMAGGHDLGAAQPKGKSQCDVLSLDSCSTDEFCYLNLGNESTGCAVPFTPAQQGSHASSSTAAMAVWAAC